MKYNATYINLDKRTDRNENMLSTLGSIVNLKRFSAIEKEIGLHGIYDSHKAVINQLKENNEGLTIIMEDDIIACSDFESRLDLFLTELPSDWDIFMLGFFSTERSSIEQVAEHIYKAKDRICAWHCYIVNPKSYDKILDEFDKDNEMNADVLMLRFQKTNNVYVAVPSFCYQDNSPSDNANGSCEIVHKATKRYFKDSIAEHKCKYCGCMTSQLDEECYKFKDCT